MGQSKNAVQKSMITGDSKEYLVNGIWPRSFALWIAAFYIALFTIRPWEVLAPQLGEIHFERIYALSMVAMVLLSAKRQLKMTFQSFAVLLFFGGIVLSAILGTNLSLSWEHLYKYLTLVVFFFILCMVIRTPYDLIFVATCYVTSMFIYLAKSQWEFFVHGRRQYTMGVIRLVGIENTFGGPNDLAMSIIISLPILIFLWSIRKDFSDGWPIFWRKWFPRFLIFYAVLAISSIILTNSRSGMVSFILFIFLITFRGRGVGRKLGYILLGTLILAMLWFVLPEEKKNRFITIYNPKAGPESAEGSAMGRIEGYKAGMAMFDRFPLTGVGIGNFIEYRVRYVDGVPLNAHNLIGQVLGETGIIGGGTFLLMVSVTLMNCHKLKILARRKPSNSTLKVLSGVGFACRDAIILLAFEGLFSHNLLRFNWLWIGAFSVIAMKHVKLLVESTSHKKLDED
jgi:O-antigen ligase